MMRTLTKKLIAIALFIGGTSYAQVTVYPYNEDFETETQGGTACTSVYTMVATGWTNEVGDDKDWSADVGGTGSTNTGPSVDHAPGNATGHYLYTEASSCFNQTAILTSPVFDLTALTDGVILDFWYHMYGQSMGTLTVEVTDDGGTSWQPQITLTDDIDLWQNASINLTQFVGSMIQVRFVGVTGADFYSDMAIDNVSMTEFVNPDDIGANSLLMPSNPLTAGTQTVTCDIINYGTNTINSATIGWSVDGVPQTPVSLGSALNAGQTSGTIILGAYNFPVGSSDICIWTELPNGNADTQPTNDTICVSLCTGLNGTYTIGGVTPDYNTFAEATNDLMNCGISGPVVFDVAAGTYNESVTLSEITGASSVNTVAFNGGVASGTIIEHDATGKNGTINLEGVDFVTFSNFTIRNTGTTDAWGVFLTDTAEFDTIQNCIIEMYQNSGVIDVAGIMSSGDPTNDLTESNGANFCVFDSNIITGGEKGISLEGENLFADWMEGIEITNNQIYNVDDYGIYVDNQRDMIVIGNWVDSIQSTFGDGIYLQDLVDFVINENIVNAPDYGLSILDGNLSTDGASTGQSSFINNMASSTSDRAIYLDDVENTNVWHNSAYNQGTGGGAIYINDPFNLDIRNNIFVSDADYAFESLDDLTIGANVVDYNMYFTNGANFISDGGAQPDLATWQTAQPTMNMNSTEQDPVFVSTTDLHVLTLTGDDLGDNSVGVAVDIDGEARPQGVNVDMGADEFTPLLNDAVLVDMLSPTPSGCGSSATEVSVIIGNLADTIFTCPVTVEITGDITQTLTGTYNDTILFNEQDTLVLGTIDTYNGGTITITAYTEYPGDQDMSNDTLYSYTATFIPFEPSGTSDPTCGYDTVMLYADSTYLTSFDWYDSASGGNLVGTGTTYTIPSISTQDTYYLQYQSGGLDSIETTFAGGNGCGAGNMFDVSAISGTTITGFRVHSGFAAGVNTPVNVYFKSGTYVGSETTAGDWTLEGSYTVVSGGAGAPSTYLSLNTPISVGPGQTVGVYVEFEADYTDGDNVYTDGNITVSTGIGICTAFAGFNASRTFNGRIYFAADPCSAVRVPVSANITAAADVNLGADSVACAANGDVILDPGTGLTNHLWFPSGNTGATETVSSNGQYIVTADDISTGCTWSDTVLIIFGECASIDEQSGLEEMNIYPNPNNGQFSVQIHLMDGVALKNIEFVAMDGRILRTIPFDSNLNSYYNEFDFSNEADGIYLLRITTDKGTALQRIILE